VIRSSTPRPEEIRFGAASTNPLNPLVLSDGIIGSENGEHQPGDGGPPKAQANETLKGGLPTLALFAYFRWWLAAEPLPGKVSINEFPVSVRGRPRD